MCAIAGLWVFQLTLLVALVWLIAINGSTFEHGNKPIITFRLSFSHQ